MLIKFFWFFSSRIKSYNDNHCNSMEMEIGKKFLINENTSYYFGSNYNYSYFIFSLLVKKKNWKFFCANKNIRLPKLILLRTNYILCTSELMILNKFEFRPDTYENSILLSLANNEWIIVVLCIDHSKTCFVNPLAESVNPNGGAK